MKNVSIYVFIVLIVLVLVLCSVSFQVRETESAVVMRFKNPSRAIEDPGFYWKWPAPIEKVVKFDSRSQLYVGQLDETTTKGADNILVESYLVWKIAKPEIFLAAVGSSITDARVHLKNLLGNAQNNEIGDHYFSEFVNSDVSKIKLAEIEQDMEDMVREQALKNFGITVEVVGVSRLGIPDSVTPKVFERMQAERSRRTETILAEGKSEATKIKSEADAKSTQLMAVVNSYAKAIRGEGDAEAAKFYKMLESEPKFAMYLQDVETLKSILKEKSTIILGSETDLINLLKGIPEIKPSAGPKRSGINK